MDRTTASSSPPWMLEARSSRAFVIAVVAIAVFTDSFIYGMIVPILPEVLKSRVAVPDDQLQTWMSILLAAFAGAILISSPIFGYFADRSSARQLPFIAGLAALGGSTVMFWFVRSTTPLVIARVLQGLSTAVVWTVGMALVIDTVGKDQIGVAMGYVSMAMTIGTVFGPFIGGVVLSQLGYHAVFSLAIGLVVFDIVLRLGMIEQKTAAKWIQPGYNSGNAEDETDDLLNDNQATSNDSVYGSTAQDHSGQSLRYHQEAQTPSLSPTTQQDSSQDKGGEPTSTGKTSSLPGFVRMLCSGNVLVVFGATVADGILYSSFDTVLPLYVIRIFQWGPLMIGLCFLPLFTPSFFSPQLGNAVDHYGARKLAATGFTLDLPVFLLLRLIQNNTTTDKVLLFVFLFLAGVAAVLQMVALMVEISVVVERREKECPGIFGQQGGTGQAYGMLNVAWSCGQMLGPLVAGFLVDRAGWATMVTVFGVAASGVAILLVLTDVRDSSDSDSESI